MASVQVFYNDCFLYNVSTATHVRSYPGGFLAAKWYGVFLSVEDMDDQMRVSEIQDVLGWRVGGCFKEFK